MTITYTPTPKEQAGLDAATAAYNAEHANDEGLGLDQSQVDGAVWRCMEGIGGIYIMERVAGTSVKIPYYNA